mgnify:CR=1 FL=1
MRKYLIAGLLVWMPLGITFLVIRAIVGFLDQTLLLLPDAYQPDNFLGIHIPGLGVLLAVVLVLATGIRCQSVRATDSECLGILVIKDSSGQNTLCGYQANTRSRISNRWTVISPCTFGGISKKRGLESRFYDVRSAR